MESTSKPGSRVAKKILIVEDEGKIALALNLVLSDREFELDYASTLLTAEEYLENNKPSVIILDNKLPDGYGVDFIGYIRKKYPSVKIIMISAFRSARDIALENGADRFLEKPFSMDNVNEAIDSVLA
jgi:DNA-binding response OmpR family regulator